MADDVGSSHVRTDSGEFSDAELVRATREGSRRAYAALYARHYLSALKYAKTLTSSDAEDVVSEAFLKVYAAIKAGHGPEQDVRYYIRSAVRNTYISMVRARRAAPAGDAIEDVVGDRGADIASLRSFDGSATTRAFLSLPTRWQEVLWCTEVEGFTREHTATLLGMNANAVSALSFRARDALRTAWLQQHVSVRSDLDRGCEATIPLLGAYSRQGLSRRDRLRVEHHVTGCAHCTSVVGELSELLTPGRLALILLPVVLTTGGFAAFAAKFGGGSAVASASAVAPPAMVLASVGGGAAGGAAALSVVGKVAACALVATMVVAPTQMLIAAAQHVPPSQSVAVSPADLDLTPLLLVEAAPVQGPVEPAAPAEVASEVGDGNAEHGGNPNPTADGAGNANGNGAGNANGSANGDGAGNANGSANGNGAGNANGNGAGNANGDAAGNPSANSVASRSAHANSAGGNEVSSSAHANSAGGNEVSSSAHANSAGGNEVNSSAAANSNAHANSNAAASDAVESEGR